jgi:hypothetical protein
MGGIVDWINQDNNLELYCWTHQEFRPTKKSEGVKRVGMLVISVNLDESSY